MTQQEFENTKWYKNMPVKESTGDPKFTYYVQGVHFETRMVLISLNKNNRWNARWEHDFFIEPVDPIHPTALDLIAAEREKQISKGYTVENDIAHYDEGDLLWLAHRLTLEVDPDCPEEWDEQYWKNLCALPYIDRVRIAATWYAKELEILLHFQNKESC